MNVIEITPTIGVTLYTCMNSETVCNGLAIDDSDREQVTSDAAEAADRVFADCLNGEVSEGASSFRDWNGGWHAKAPTRYHGLAVHWFSRRPIDADDWVFETSNEPTDLDSCITWSEWEHLPLDKVPAVIRFGVEELLARAANARQAVFAEAEASEIRYQATADNE